MRCVSIGEDRQGVGNRGAASVIFKGKRIILSTHNKMSDIFDSVGNIDMYYISSLGN